MAATYIPGPLIVRDNLLVICPGDYRASSETRNAGEGREGRAGSQHDGRWGVRA